MILNRANILPAKMPNIYVQNIFLLYQTLFLDSLLPQYMALCVSQLVSQFVKKKFQVTSKQGRRLKFGMLTVLTNIRSTKVL